MGRKDPFKAEETVTELSECQLWKLIIFMLAKWYNWPWTEFVICVNQWNPTSTSSDCMMVYCWAKMSWFDKLFWSQKHLIFFDYFFLVTVSSLIFLHYQWHSQFNQKYDTAASIHTVVCCRMLSSDLISVQFDVNHHLRTRLLLATKLIQLAR